MGRRSPQSLKNIQTLENEGQKYKIANIRANFPFKTLQIDKWTEKLFYKENNTKNELSKEYVADRSSYSCK